MPFAWLMEYSLGHTCWCRASTVSYKAQYMGSTLLAPEYKGTKAMFQIGEQALWTVFTTPEEAALPRLISFERAMTAR